MTVNPLATKLNETLQGTVAEGFLSHLGKRLYFPRGIAAQSEEAAEKAHRLNATAGMAYKEGKPLFLHSVRDFLPRLDADEIFPYAPNPGVLELRHLWKEKMIEKNPTLHNTTISIPVVVPGITTGIATVADLFIDKGDNVFLPDMFWGNYRLIFEIRKEAKLITYPFFSQAGEFNTTALKNAIIRQGITSKIMLIFNFPNNPTGYSPSVSEAHALLATLGALADSGYQICVVMDDAYFGLFYEDEIFKESLFAALASLHENIFAVKVDGATKEDLAWGFRIGFLTFGSKCLHKAHYEALVKKTMGALRASISSSSRLAQSILLKAMAINSYEREKDHVFRILEARYRRSREILSAVDPSNGASPLPFNSGYFLTLHIDRGKAEEVRRRLLHERGIGAISITDSYLRVAYSSVDIQNLAELFDEIFKATRTVLDR